MQRPGYPNPLDIPTDVLALPGTIHRKSMGRSLEYWLSWLSQSVQGPYIKLRRAILSKDIPAHIVHHFACDCIERTMSLHQHIGSSLPGELWDAFDAKRLWIEGRMTWNEFEEQYKDPAVELLHDIKESLTNHLLQMLKGALRKEHTSAALSSIYHPIFPQDRVWQCQRMKLHLLSLQQQLERLNAILHYRSQTLDPQIQHWRQTLEDVLF